jgi:hypothetical protein
MTVHVDEARHQDLAAGVDTCRTAWNGHTRARSCRADPLAIHDDNRVVYRRTAGPVDETRTDYRDRARRGRWPGRRLGGSESNGERKGVQSGDEAGNDKTHRDILHASYDLSYEMDRSLSASISELPPAISRPPSALALTPPDR